MLWRAAKSPVLARVAQANSSSGVNSSVRRTPRTALRDEYEHAFSRAIQDLPLPPRTDRRALRLMLLGALNWSQTWYRSGKDSPQVLARRFVRLLRDPLDT